MAHIGRNNLITRAEAAEQQDLRLRQEKQRRRDITAEVKALERTMDPILAPQVWNARNSCLLQLPNELLLPILKGVVVKSQDRRRISRVCRQLRQLVKEPSLKCGFWERTSFLRRARMMPTSFLEGLNLVCPSCSDDFRPGPRLEYTNQGQEPHSSTICAFLERPARYVYCSGCKLWHPKLAFSPAQQREGPNERICIGREGVLRVCEHLSIPWTDIEARIAQARVAFPQDWRLFMAALEQIEFVCKDESHVLPCRFDRSSEPRRGSWLEPSFPRATVVARQGICESQGLCLCLTLELSWQPHSGQLQWPLKKKVEQLETSASGMRDLVSFYRQSVARFIVPDRSPRYMPEMLCFDPDQCSCLHYESGLSEEESTPSLYEKQECTQMPIKSERVFTEPQLETRHHYTFGQNTRDTSSVQIFRCRDLTAAPEGDTDGTLGSCIVTRYNRRIFLGILFWRDVTRAGATTGLQSPSHEWSHAMDPDSYQWSSSIPRDDQEMFVQRRCLHVWHSRYFRQPNLCSQVRAARGFLSVDSLNLPDSRVVAPRWMPLREDLSLRNLPCLVVEWICGAYQGYDVYRALPSCEINFRHLRRSIALVVALYIYAFRMEPIVAAGSRIGGLIWASLRFTLSGNERRFVYGR